MTEPNEIGMAVEQELEMLRAQVRSEVTRMAQARVAGYRAAAERTRAAIPRSVRREVWVRDGGRCRKCGITDAEAMVRDGEHLQYDHIHPWSLNGADTVNNIQLLCGRCNRAKGDRPDPLAVPRPRMVYGKYGRPKPPEPERRRLAPSPEPPDDWLHE
jgi:5-methylcytosine-specific restriction endonuclease McrA